MFEDSLVESRVGEISSSRRWTTVASITLQFAVAGLVIALPLLHPEAVSFEIEAPKMLLPSPPKPPKPPVRVQRVTEAASNAASPELSRPPVISTMVPSSVFSASEEPSLLAPDSGMGMRTELPGGLLGGSGPHPSVTVGSGTPHKRIDVSSGVSEGMLITPIRPGYPAIARAAHVEGTVVVEAVISRNGTIESLHVLRGPTMLQSAAIEAIRGARYRPYRLNGEPVDVQTIITVNFRMGA
ncbi:energy transducer TonB [Tunturiibacter gelidoferens]|jgi:periplasmic protein TonB|uniref:Protein TonB n=1 Tax=Tunturiibacter gelidiferens TaxID=3069689 RepID=A0A9X0QI90_9BACT|nr:energy transducer TonB [Edaphobacter lichenicola]MBB5330644.1 protein TonB [Edaphobacter lichenicola]